MSEFHRLILGLHADARRIDRDQALLGALGVGAFAYTHQLDSVHRMITGTACRWLLADEVGLGKTIQAIMVMRALAAQSPKPLATALVVPDDLVSQWEEELLSRGHVLALESGEEGVGPGNVIMRLVRPSRIIAGGRLSSNRIDLLLVDEFTKLQVEVREELIASARTIPNVLVMTATPALHHQRNRRELMALLEPEADRIAKAEDIDILDVLRERESRACQLLGDNLREPGKRRLMEECFGFYRRIIRTIRTDYPDALPKRSYQPIKLSPTDGDVERARATRAYLAEARASNLDIRREALLQVAGRSPQSLRERLSTLRRGNNDLLAAWTQIETCLRNEPGDAKLDALIDHLRIFQTQKPKGRAVVVAEDNPTTDYLRDAIEKLTDLKVAKKRRSAIAADELNVQVTLLNEALEDFITGEARILVAADVAREGHNLQFADEIIFFALPWSPPDIQQWIGRIDRLGTKGSPANRLITITPIVVDGSNEMNILLVLEGTGVFLKSEVFDESDWEGISKAIRTAADGGNGGSWGDAVKQATTLGDTYDNWLKATSLPPSSRTSLAVRYEERLRQKRYAAPSVSTDNDKWNWFHARERGIETMLKLAREDFLEIRNDQDGEQRFQTMWYKSKPPIDGLTIPDLDERSSWHRQAFISKRTAIECPPRTYVVQADGEKRRLHFFDHGCALHDGVIAAFQKQAPASNMRAEFVVEYPLGHPMLQFANQRVLVVVSEIHFSDVLSFNPEAILSKTSGMTSKAELEARETSIKLALTQFQADRRWLIDLCPPEMLLATIVEDGNEMVVVEAGPALMNPYHHGKATRQLSKQRSLISDEKREIAKNIAIKQIGKLGREMLGQATLNVRRAVENRLFSAKADAENYAQAAQAEIKAAMARDNKFEFNRAAVRGAELALTLALHASEARVDRLKAIEKALETTVKLKPPKLFWLIPRPPIKENP
jgi:superfamily II DNA or RNA helicase